MILQNSWLVYQKYQTDDDPNHDLLSFRCDVANMYFLKYKERKVALRRPSNTARKVPLDIRFDGLYHYQLDMGRTDVVLNAAGVPIRYATNVTKAYTTDASNNIMACNNQFV